MIYILSLLWLINRGYRNLSIIFKERLLVWGIILLMLGVSIATIFSWDLRTSAGIWKAWFVDAVLFFIVFATTIKLEEIKKVFLTSIFSGFVITIISLAYLIQGNLNFQGRLQGIFNSPNYLAMYLAVPLILSLWLSLRISTKNYFPEDTGQRPSAALRSFSASPLTMRLGLRKVFLVSSFLFLGIGLVFTKSYGVWLGILSALVFGILVYLYRKNRKNLFFLFVFLGFALIFVLGLLKIQSLEGLESFDARFVIWLQALKAFQDNFPIGIGPGTFENYFPLYPKWGVPQPHNIFLAFLLQTGIVGFIGFVLVLIWFFRTGLKNFQFSIYNLQSIFNLQLLMVMVYILAHGLVDTTYWKNDLAIIFWTLIGIMILIKKEPQ
jgi:O-antigen ligase